MTPRALLASVTDKSVAIIGGGIGGLTLALSLHRAGIPFRVYESAPELKPLGVGLNLLPHATGVLAALGLLDKLMSRAVETRELCFFTRNGQLVDREPRGRLAGYEWPQISIHRGDLHAVLLGELRARAGADAIALGHKCVAVEQDENSASVAFREPISGEALPTVTAALVIGCDGIHSVIRKRMHPNDAKPRHEGTIQFRGTSLWRPFLSGATMIYVGTYETGKLVMYPIRNDVDGEGRQLVNWVVEVARPSDQTPRDWNRRSRVEEFIERFEHCNFEWLDIPSVLRAADAVYEYPVVDQDPLPYWTVGRITLLGDAAHPMTPRGSNGAAQAILDARTLTSLLAGSEDLRSALKEYETLRLKATSDVVLANRQNSPDAILRVVEERTGGRRFERIEDVISQDELRRWQARYKKVAGFALEDLARKRTG